MRKIKILLAEDEEVLRDVLEMIIEAEIDAQIIKAHNGEEAITELKNQADIDLVISDYHMPKKNGGDVYLFNAETKNLPLFILSGGDISDYPQLNNFLKTNDKNRFIHKPFDADHIIGQIKSITESLSAVNSQINEKFIKVKLIHFIKYAQDVSDVYINIHGGKLTKIVDEQTEKEKPVELLNKYLQKGLEYIFIEKEKFQNLIKGFSNLNTSYVTPEEVINLAGIQFHISLSSLESIGVSAFQIEMISSVIEETILELQKGKFVDETFAKLIKNEGFLIGHSLYMMYLAGGILKELNFKYTTTMKKICLASFFHDASLIDDSIASFETLKELPENSKFKNLYMNHPSDSAALLKLDQDLLEDTKKLILEHHEKADGSGFPKGLLGNQVSPLSAVFILCHDIAINLIQNNFSKESLKHFLIKNESFYSLGNFVKPYQVALKIYG